MYQSVLCPVLIGRADSLARMQALLQRAHGGEGRVLLVSGEAGVGKTRLLQALVRDAREAGFLVLEGACFEAERATPYAPLADLVRTLAVGSSPALAAHVLGAAAPELLALFPELRPIFPETVPSVAGDPEQDRRRLFHALATALRAVGERQPVLLLLDDVHWSDDATLDLVLHLTRGLGAQRALVALSYRAEEVGPRLARLLAELDRTRSAEEVALARLTGEEVAAMVGAILGEPGAAGAGFLHTLHELTDGNPFFVEEVLKLLVSSGELAARAEGGWAAGPLERVQVPRTAVEAVRRRLSGLSPEARELAALAAVVGRRFDFDLLQALTGAEERALLSRVRELIAAQLVVEEAGERIAFRHALTREAIYAELLARERVALHRAVAEVLERRTGSSGPPAEALAYHTFEAGDWPRARAFAAQAAEHALALYAPREALAHLERALAAAEREGVPPGAPLLLARGRARETLGDFEGARADFEAVLERARSQGQPRDAWQALHALGMLWSARDYARAGEHRARALELARELGDAALLARSLNRVGNWHLNLEQPAPALRFHARALELFQQLGEERGVAETVDLVAMAQFIAGDQVAAAAQWERAVALFTALGDRRGIARGMALVALSAASVPASATVLGSSSMVREVLARERPVRLAGEIGWRAGEAFVRFILADSFAWLGRYDRALALAREAHAIACDLEHLEWQCGAQRSLGFIALDLLAPGAAQGSLQAAHEIALRLGSRTWTRWTAAPLAVALARLGEIAAARALLDEADAPAALGREALLPDDELAPTLGQRQLRLARAEVALADGAAAEALAIVEERLADELHARPGPPPALPRLHLLRGLALADAGREGEAEGALRTAIAEGLPLEAAPLLWRAQAALGHVQLRLRRRLDAHFAFDAARELAGRLAARIPDPALRASFEAGVATLVPAPRRPSLRQAAKSAFGGLTRREREVAQLVAGGRSNRGIARSLGIGERTVEDHVAHALAKLGFSSRAQLAAWAVEKGLAQSPLPGRRA